MQPLFDNSNIASGSTNNPLSIALTVGTLVNGVVYADVRVSTSAATPTGVTCNGVAMTKFATYSAGGEMTSWFLPNPSPGTNTIVVSFSQKYDGAEVAVSSYSRASQVAPTNISTQTGTEGSGVNFPSTLTTLVDKSLTHLWVQVPATGDNINASTGTTLRSRINGYFMGDSNSGITPPASYTMNVTTGGTDTFFSIMYEIAPAASAAVNTDMRMGFGF